MLMTGAGQFRSGQVRSGHVGGNLERSSGDTSADGENMDAGWCSVAVLLLVLHNPRTEGRLCDSVRPASSSTWAVRKCTSTSTHIHPHSRCREESGAAHLPAGRHQPPPTCHTHCEAVLRVGRQHGLHAVFETAPPRAQTKHALVSGEIEHRSHSAPAGPHAPSHPHPQTPSHSAPPSHATSQPSTSFHILTPCLSFSSSPSHTGPNSSKPSHTPLTPSPSARTPSHTILPTPSAVPPPPKLSTKK